MNGFTRWSWWGVVIVGAVLGIVILVGNSWALFLSGGGIVLEPSFPKQQCGLGEQKAILQTHQ